MVGLHVQSEIQSIFFTCVFLLTLTGNSVRKCGATSE